MKSFLRLAFLLLAGTASAEDVQVKYRNSSVPLDSFYCTQISDSSLVYRACYDEGQRYLLLNLKNTYYHYCEVDPQLVSDLLAAESKGRFYTGTIKSNSNGGKYDCRNHIVPRY